MRVLTLVLLFCSLPLWAQTCLTGSIETTPAAEFVDNEDGTVTDTTTGLMWMQCSVGQIWVEGACTGDASELNWQEALQSAHGLTFANQSGWRLPNIKELASLTERNCVRPSINAGLFPATPPDDFWTSTPSVTDGERAWVVAFFNSSNAIRHKNLFVFARLVRTVTP